MKPTNKMTVEEILRQQLELLAERSANEKNVVNLIRLTNSIIELQQALKVTERKQRVTRPRAPVSPPPSKEKIEQVIKLMKEKEINRQKQKESNQ